MAKDLEQAIICVDEDRRIEIGEKKNPRTPKGKELRDNLIKRVRQKTTNRKPTCVIAAKGTALRNDDKNVPGKFRLDA
jgi:hypothetical protein